MTATEDEVRRLARDYEAALTSGDTDMASSFFDDDQRTSRFGPDGSQLDVAAVRQMRAAAAASNPARWVHDSAREVSTGVVLHIALLERGGATIQRTQLWVRRGEAMRIVHAHVSRIASPIGM